MTTFEEIKQAVLKMTPDECKEFGRIRAEVRRELDGENDETEGNPNEGETRSR